MAESRNVRLQKYIADCGITSRRKAEDLIVKGRVNVNGETVTVLGSKIDPSIDAVMVDGLAIDSSAVDKLYILMNKPRGYMTTLHDPEGRKTVLDICREITERIYPVGRLDYLSEGLLIMTNDGEVANQIMHPRHNIVKVYEVKVFGAVSEGILKKLRTGVEVDGHILKPLNVRVIKQLPTKTWLEFRLGEGRNREIRKICEACGLTVDKLRRVAIGGMSIDGISPGNYTLVTKKQLFDRIGLNKDGTPNGREYNYRSIKKSINIKKKGVQEGTSADDETFVKFRRETYFETLKAIKVSKEETIEKKKNEAYEAREAAHADRVQKKKSRADRKSKIRFHNQKVTHAQVVKK
jgi:23S rRNA pseudouridine2605 synthase